MDASKRTGRNDEWNVYIWPTKQTYQTANLHGRTSARRYNFIRSIRIKRSRVSGREKQRSLKSAGEKNEWWSIFTYAYNMIFYGQELAEISVRSNEHAFAFSIENVMLDIGEYRMRMNYGEMWAAEEWQRGTHAHKHRNTQAQTHISPWKNSTVSRARSSIFPLNIWLSLFAYLLFSVVVFVYGKLECTDWWPPQPPPLQNATVHSINIMTESKLFGENLTN